MILLDGLCDGLLRKMHISDCDKIAGAYFFSVLWFLLFSVSLCPAMTKLLRIYNMMLAANSHLGRNDKLGGSRKEVKMNYSTAAEIVETLRAGKIVIVADEEDRENEGDLIAAAEFATPEVVNFMVTHGKGLLCQALTPRWIAQLGIPAMQPMECEQEEESRPMHDTAFLMSVDAKTCLGAGVSAVDRSITTRKLIDRAADYLSDFYSPGHCFPLKAADKGLEERLGHTEVTIDLMLLADLFPSGILCEILNADGTMARLPEMFQLAQSFAMPIPITHVLEVRQEIERLGGRDALVAASQYREFY